MKSTVFRFVYSIVLGWCVLGFFLWWIVFGELLTYEWWDRCQRYDRWDSIVWSSACLDELPSLAVDEHLYYLLRVSQDVSSEYNAILREFTYTPSQLILNPWEAIRLEQEYKELESTAQSVISISKTFVAYHTRHRYRYVASTRDISTYGPCRKQNYHIAMNEIDGVVLMPQEKINMNDRIANKPWYCTWWWSYRFFSGVCGWSTQLFWNAILHPWLEVLERHNHGKRYAWFYGSTVMWDDSSIYERSKRLILQNTTDQPIWFGTFTRERDGNRVLVSAWESNTDREVLIQKEQHGPRKALLRSTIYDWVQLLQRDDWTSVYYWIDESVDETAALYRN